MLSPEIAQLRELIAARIHAADCDCADFASPRCELRMAGTYRAIADSVLELFPAPGATTRPDPSTEKRVVLIKPGDVLLIGGVQFHSAQQADEGMRRFKELTGITPVVFFADDIQIDALTAEQITRLATQESA